MRKFVTTCIDDVTGHTMVLSEVSYNVAMEWLQREAEKYGKEIFRIETEDDNLMTIYTGEPRIGCDGKWYTNDEKWYTNIVKFFYDEMRGYLMEE